MINALRGLLAVAPGWTDRHSFMQARNVPQPDQAALLTAAPAIPAGGLIFAPAVLDGIRQQLVEALAAYHRASPELPGLQPTRLRLTLAERPPVPAFAAVLEAMRDDGLIAQDGPWFRLPNHRVRLSPQDEKLWHAASPLIAADRFRPPRVFDIARTLDQPVLATRITLKRLMRMGQLVEIAPDHFFLRETVAEMAAIATALEAEAGQVTAASFRDKLSNGRKVAILILEFFDKVGLTIRQGDERKLRPDRLRMFGPADGSVEGSATIDRQRHPGDE